MVGTRGQILWLKCTKFDFGWGSISDPDGELTALPKSLVRFKGPTSKGGREGKGEGRGSRGKGMGGRKVGMRGRGDRREERGKDGRDRETWERTPPHPLQNVCVRA